MPIVGRQSTVVFVLDIEFEFKFISRRDIITINNHAGYIILSTIINPVEAALNKRESPRKTVGIGQVMVMIRIRKVYGSEGLRV